MKQHSQRQQRNYRIKTQEQKAKRERNTTPIPNKNSIVFQSQVKSLQNYFQFLQTVFGKRMEIKQMVKNLPHENSLREQLGKQSLKRRSKSQFNHEPQQFQCIKLKTTTVGVQKSQNCEGYRNGFKHSIIQIPSSSLKTKFYDSQRKRHSYLMQRMSHVPRKANTSPIQYQQFLKNDQYSEFLPVGKCIGKDPSRITTLKPRLKLSTELMKGITYKRPKHERIFLKHLSEVKHPQYDAQKSDEANNEGPWRIIDTTEYNPRSYFSTFR